MRMSSRTLFVLTGVIVAGGCDARQPAEPGRDSGLAAEVRVLAARHDIGRLPARPQPRPSLVRLGQALAFDRILSGDRDISCMDCHLPRLGTGDGMSLSVGTGSSGSGIDRVHPEGVLIPRNAPPVYNLNAMRTLFWDGRVEVDGSGRFRTPAGAQLTPAMTKVFEFGALSAQAMFPVQNRAEMRGSGNELAAFADDDFTGIWQALMMRLGAIQEYRELFEAAYSGSSFDEMTFAHASNAIAAFLVDRLTFEDSPWDKFLAGDDHVLSPGQLAGAKVFMTFKCADCHSGPAFSDQEFHNIAMPQIGPGQGNGASGRDDFGRFNVTRNAADMYRFRTPPLRNVALTGPFGHDGAYVELRRIVDHYSDSHIKVHIFDPTPLAPALRGTLLANAQDLVATRDTLLDGLVLTTKQVDELLDYLAALTDPAARSPVNVVPARVPSGLPVGQ